MNSTYDGRGADQRSRMDGRDADALRTDIERTRGRMSDTLDQIGERLNVNRIKGEVRDTVREQVQETKDKVRAATIGRAQNMARNAADSANDARHSLMHTIRENPVPAAMVGIGLGWLMMGSRRERKSLEHRQGHLRTDFAGGAIVGAGSENTYAAGGYYADQHTDHAVSTDTGYTDDRGTMDRAKEKASSLGHSVKDRASEVKEGARHVAGDVAERTRHVAEDVRDRARNVASTVSERTHEMVDGVGERTQRMAYRTRSTIDDNPVAMGAVALAVGLAAGMTIPASRREAELMGPTRDRVIDRARSYADETREKVQRVASEVVDDARIAARDAVEEVRESAKEAAREEGLMGDDSSTASSGMSAGSSSGSSAGSTGLGSQLGRTSGIRPDMGGTDGSI